MLDRQTIEFRSSFTREKTARELAMGESRTVGTEGDIVLDGPDVRREHIRVNLGAEGWTVSPAGENPVSVNGQVVGEAHPLADGDWISLGTTLFQVSLPGQSPLGYQPPITRRTAATRRARPQPGVLTIGRLPECDLAIPSPLVSREHARLYCEPSGVEIEDLGSTNGTFVNGQRLIGRMRLNQDDRIAIASFFFLFTGEALEPIDLSGQVRVEVCGLYKDVIDRASKTPKRLLDDLNLVIEPGEFVVIFGTSGSGKSTLLDALNGRRPATGGNVFYNGADLYACFDSFRASIGYVPQQDIVHRKITVRNALQYTASLRLPPDTSKREVGEYIDRVLDQVGLAEKSYSPIDTPAPLSGGQLKRVSLAVELVANPHILFLDEVTSGLDAGTDKRMMKLFADLALDKKTVVCVTHTLENIDVCHLVILLHQGKLVYFGPPGEAAEYFGVKRLSDVYDLLEGSPAERWAQQYRASEFYRRYVEERMRVDSTRQASPHSAATLQMLKPHASWFDWRQAGTLMRRYLDLILSDRKNLLILLLQAPLIAVVIGLVFNTEGHLAVRAAAESQIAFILVLSAIWFGTLNSARELVKELPIYLRERSVNLGLTPYLISKLLPLAALCLIQCTLLLGLVSIMLAMPGSFAERLATLFCAGLAASCMGLAVSAFVDSNDKAVAMAPILLIPQMVLSNAVVRLGEAGLWVAKCSMVSYWALDAMKSTLSVDSRTVRDMSGQLIVPVSGVFGQDLAMVSVLGILFLGLAVLGLKLKDRRK
ncbi:MAG: FHA domain-containing protein [Methylococcaceae bacterium]|nr:FHA domain-containing protein [Methylococcaceae bacterium]